MYIKVLASNSYYYSNVKVLATLLLLKRKEKDNRKQFSQANGILACIIVYRFALDAPLFIISSFSPSIIQKLQIVNENVP